SFTVFWIKINRTYHHQILAAQSSLNKNPK
ncbi:MAG: hypothetical protein ACI9RZ_000629, partial [Sphingobacteriales bacterium]